MNISAAIADPLLRQDFGRGDKEKVLAAHRAGIKWIILPKANKKDLKDVPQEVRENLTFIPVERIEEVLPAAFNHDTAVYGGFRFGTGIVPTSA